MLLFAWPSTFALACLVWLAGTALGYSALASAGDLAQLALEGEPLAQAQGPDREVPGPAAAAPAEREGWRLFAFLLSRNLTVYLWLLTGILCAGVSTFFVLAGNGLMLGQLVATAVAAGLPAGALADMVLTHGVLEIGALCIAGAVGFQGWWLMQHWAQGGWPAVRALRLGWVLAFGVAALTVAAGIEAFVTTELSTAWIPDLGGAA